MTVSVLINTGLDNVKITVINTLVLPFLVDKSISISTNIPIGKVVIPPLFLVNRGE